MWGEILAAIGIWFITAIAVERLTEFIKDSEMPIMMAFKSFIYKGMANGTFAFASLYKLFSCGWCIAGWVSFAFAFTLPGPFFITNWLAIWGLAGLWHSFFELVYRGRVQTVDLSITDNRLNKSEDIELDIGDD